MQHLEVSGAVRPLKWPLGVKWLKTFRRNRFCPEEDGSSYIRNAGNMPPLKMKIDVITYETVSQMSVTDFVTKFTIKKISIYKK